MMKKWAFLLWEKIKNLWEKITSEPFLRGLLICLLVVVAGLFLIVVCTDYPIWTKRYLGLTEKNETLTFLGIGMGGLLVALQALMSYKRAKALEDTVKNTEKGQRQERLKNAIEHLGHDKDSVRLGGAYELFHLAEETKEWRQTILDILCAHIRQTTGEKEYREKHKSKPSEEIQSLLTLLFDGISSYRLTLSPAVLPVLKAAFSPYRNTPRRNGPKAGGFFRSLSCQPVAARSSGSESGL